MTIDETQRHAINRLLTAIGTIPQSRMEYVIGLVETCQKEHSLTTPVVAELRELAAAQGAMADAFHWRTL